MHEMKCSEVWGGVRNEDIDVCTRGVTATLYSGAADGGKGGDIYYFSQCGSDMLTRIAIADVVGHGEAVSAVSQWLYDQLVEGMNDPDSAAVLHRLNGLTTERGFKAITTAAVIAYYTASSRLFVADAGHPPVLVRRDNESGWRPVPLTAERAAIPANLPLGVAADTPYDQAELPLASHDRVLFFTDGVLETPNPAGELFGNQRLMETLNATGDASLYDIKQSVLEALRHFAAGPLSHDDVTLMAIEIR